jgi:hypothetical protein
MVAGHLPFDLHLSHRVPYRGVKKEQHSRRKRQSIPDSIAAANVVEFVVQNIVQF